MSPGYMPPQAERIQRSLAALDAEPGLTHEELAQRIGLPSLHALFLLQRLEADGRAVHEATRWFAVDAGDPTAA